MQYFTVGELIKSYRVKRGLSQPDVVNRLPIKLRAYQGYEGGERIPGKLLPDIVAALDLDENEKAELYRAANQVAPEKQNLPFLPNLYFTGRTTYLEELYQQLRQNRSVCLSGLAGIGKTQLTLAYAHRSHPKVYRTVLWVNAANLVTLETSYLALAHLLELPEKDEREANSIVEAVKKWLEDHEGWLLILDNADDLDVTRSFLPTGSRGHILFTTRSQIADSIAKQIKVLEMEPEEAVSFLLRRSRQGAEADTLLPSVREAAARLAELLGELPLALDQAGAYIQETGISFDDYIQKYHQQRSLFLNQYGPLDTKHPEHPETVVITFEICFHGVHELCPVSTEVLCFCSFLHPDDIPEELLSLDTHLGLNPLLFDKAIAALRRYSLIRRQAEKRLLSIHRLVQAVVQDRLLEQERKGWITRVISIMHKAFPQTVEYDTWDQCERYLPHARACTQSGEQGHLTPLEEAQLLNRVAWYLRERARYEEAELLLRRAIAIGGEGVGLEHSVLHQSWHELAHLSFRQGRYEEAELLYERELETYKQQSLLSNPNIAETLNIIAALNGLADTCRVRGKLKKALAYFQQAHVIYESLSTSNETRIEAPIIATFFSNWGLVYLDMGEYEKAEPLLQRALAIRKKLLSAEDPAISFSLNTLAGLYEKLGKYKEAELLFLQGLEIDEKAYSHKHPEVAIDLTALAGIYIKQGKYNEAETRLQQALAIQEEMLEPQHLHTAETLNLLGLLYLEQGEYEKAEPLLQHALVIKEQQLGQEHPSVGITLNNLGLLYLHTRKYEEAKLLLQQALAIKAQQLGQEHPNIAQGLNNLGMVYYEQRKYEKAEPLFLQALGIRETQLGSHHPDTAESLANLAGLRLLQGKYQDARSMIKRALAIYEHSLGPYHPTTESVRKIYRAFHSVM